MEVREAVQAARTHISEIFVGEMLTDIGLEEVRFDDQEGVWLITIGFSRPWDAPKAGGLLEGTPPSQRTYMTVRLDDDTGKALELTRRAWD